MKTSLRPCTWMQLLTALVLQAFFFFTSPAQHTNSHADLTSLPIEKLLDMEVTSVARKTETLSQSPAAIAVITADDIRRSGETSIPEALRLAPGVEAGRLDASQWA